MIPVDLTKDQTLQLHTQQKREAAATGQRNRQLLSISAEKWCAQGDWTQTREDGYAEGKRHFQRGLTPSTLMKVSLDEYARGFRAGYYLRVRLQNQAALAGFTNQAG